MAQLNSAFDPGGCNCQCQHMSTVDLMIWQIGIGTKIPSEIEETDLQEEELLAARGFQSPGGDGFRNRNATDLVQW